MHGSPTGSPARVAFERLIDYAGLFPPAALTMREAVSEYGTAREGKTSWLLGRFVVPATRASELAEEIAAPMPFALSVIVDADSDPRRWFASAQEVLTSLAQIRQRDPRMHFEALEVPLPRLGSQRERFDAAIAQCALLTERAGLRDLRVFAEFPRTGRERLPDATAFAALARAGFGAKIRCGGTNADAIPSVEEIAHFVRLAAEAAIAFKATAGLHHAVRHHDADSGAPVHGFLNLFAAALFADRRSDELIAIVGEEDATAFSFDEQGFRWRHLAATLDEIATARARRYVSYGSCSFAEPVEELRVLGVLTRGTNP